MYSAVLTKSNMRLCMMFMITTLNQLLLMNKKTIAAGKFFARMGLLLITLVVMAGNASLAQQKKITGVVTNPADNTPVVNASVMVKGTARGTTTDTRGRFTISATGKESLIISAVGFQVREVAINDRDSLTIQLVLTDKELENVVVTALGIRREERSLGYATTVVKGDQLTDAMSGNWTDALSGKVAGLNLVRSGSGPAGSNKIILRGENNLTGDNEALIVIDGVVINQSSGRRNAISGESTYGTGSDNMPADYGSSLNDLNSEDIESVNILSGPGAAALYGQRAANGAIVITTKSGRSKKNGLGVTVSSNASIEQINRWPDLQYEYGQGLAGQAYYSFGASVDGASTSSTSSAYGPRFEGQMFYQFDPVTQAQGKERTPWVAYPHKIRNYFETGNTFTNTVSIDGGSDKTSARFSLTNVKNQWIIPNTGYNRNTVTLSVNSKVSEKLQISSRINYTNKWSDNLPGAGYGNQSIMYWFIFWQPNADLDWLKDYWVKGQEKRKILYPYSSFPENPYAVAYEFINRSNRHVVTGNVQATYQFTDNLSLMVRTSMDLSYENRAQERPYDAGSKFPKGSYRIQSIFSQEASTDFMLKYQRDLNKDFSFSATFGGSVLRNNYNREETRADSLTFPGVYTMANNAGPLISLPYKSKYGINSLFGVITTSYKEVLYFDLTARQDWASVLATPNRTENSGFFYPSANVSLILSDVMKMPKQIDYAKVRFSASGVGSGQSKPYLTAYNYTSAGSLFSGGLSNPSLLANPDLRPLRTISFEAGTDLKMFKGRLGLNLSVYAGTTKDQILERILDRSTGYTRMVINAGKVQNKGIEITLSGTPVKSKDGLTWNTHVVFFSNRNRIAELADSSVVLRLGPVGGGQIVAQVGGSMGDLYGRGYVRSPDGQVVYDGNTGVALITEEVKYLGNVLPKFKVGFGNDFKYKRFRLHLLFDAQYGAVAHSLMHYKLAEQGKLTKTLPGRYNGIIGNGVVLTGDGKYIPNTVIATDIDQYYRSHFGIDNAEGSVFRTDFIKFREARLDYSLGPNALKKLGLQRATIGVYGRDLFIWSDWPMFDPEFGTLSGNDIVQGFEIGQFPSTRTMGVNIVVGF